MPIYYPSMAVNFTMRFDEALLSGGSTPSPSTPDDGADKSSLAPGGAVAQSGLFDVSDKKLTHVWAIIPRTCTMELSTYRQAPKFNLSFSFRDFPVDPRAIRALGVEIYIATVKADDWAGGMAGQTDSNGRLLSQLVLKDENRMLVGLVDSHAVKHGEKGSVVTMEGRGLAGLMLSAKMNAQQLKTLNVNQPIDAIVKNILAMDAQGQNIPVRIGDGSNGSPNDWPNGVPKGLPPEVISRVLKGAKASDSGAPKTGLAIKSDPNLVGVWDVITNCCNLVGAVPYFIGHELWIRPAKSIYEQKNAGQTGSTPFAGGRTRSIINGTTQETINFRKMVYGRDLTELNFERKFGSTTVPQIRCVSVDNTKVGKAALVEAVYPPDGSPEAAVTTAVSPGGAQSRTEISTIPVPGITDQTRLASIAEQIWHEIGRGEMKGSASSKDLATLGGDNSDADIIRLRPGDAVEFSVDASGVQSLPPVVSELTNQASSSPQAAIAAVNARLGGNRQDLAQVLVGAARGAYNGLQNTFRVNNVKYTWDMTKGLGVDFDFQNYIQARYDKAGSSSGGLGPSSSSPSPTFGSSGGP